MLTFACDRLAELLLQKTTVASGQWPYNRPM